MIEIKNLSASTHYCDNCSQNAQHRIRMDRSDFYICKQCLIELSVRVRTALGESPTPPTREEMFGKIKDWMKD